MKQNLFGIAALIVSLGVAWWARNIPKIGYAETSVLLAEFTEAVKAKKEFEIAQKEWDGNLKRINDSLMAAVGRLKTGYEKAAPDARSALERDVERWNGDLQRYTGAIKKMSEAKEKELMTPVLNKMNSFLATWGKEHGYDMVFGTMNGGNILQAKEGFNVTRDLLNDLNEHYRDPAPARTGADTGKPNSQPAETKSKDSLKQP